jgi:tetratricopeptide (TPR) repeat protein
MRRGLGDLLATGAEVARPYWLGLIAGAHAEAGEVQQGLGILAEALAVANEERWCEPELHRQRGELLRLEGDDAEAERCFRRAINVARQQRSRAPELCAVASLGRLRAPAAEASRRTAS